MRVPSPLFTMEARCLVSPAVYRACMPSRPFAALPCGACSPLLSLAADQVFPLTMTMTWRSVALGLPIRRRRRRRSRSSISRRSTNKMPTLPVTQELSAPRVSSITPMFSVVGCRVLRARDVCVVSCDCRMLVHG